jgi:transcriptional regulator with GAF, ATPase, and Fis domain
MPIFEADNRMFHTVSIVILALFGIFIRPFDPGTFDFIYRFIIFAAITFLLYNKWRIEPQSKQDITEVRRSPGPQQKHAEINLKNTWTIDDLLKSDEKSSDYLRDQFEIMANVLFPDTGWIFYQQDAEQIVVYHMRDFSGKGILADEKTFSPGGVIKILGDEGKILIENNLSEGSHLLPYHQNQEYTPHSFIGIPIMFSEGKGIFFAFDSRNKDHFNQDDRPLLEKLSRSIETFLINRIKGYQLIKSLERVQEMLNFTTELNSCKTITLAIEILIKRISQEFEATRLTLSVVASESGKAVIRKVIGQEDEFGAQTVFSTEEGLTGWVISKNKPYLIDDMEKGEYFIPRYSKTEKTNYGLRAFLGVPITSDDTVYGALTLEHHEANKYSEQEKDRLQSYLNIFSTTFQRQKS